MNPTMLAMLTNDAYQQSGHFWLTQLKKAVEARISLDKYAVEITPEHEAFLQGGFNRVESWFKVADDLVATYFEVPLPAQTEQVTDEREAKVLKFIWTEHFQLEVHNRFPKIVEQENTSVDWASIDQLHKDGLNPQQAAVTYLNAAYPKWADNPGVSQVDMGSVFQLFQKSDPIEDLIDILVKGLLSGR